MINTRRYNIKEGYTLVSEKTRCLTKKYELNEKEARHLYRILLHMAKSHGEKYSEKSRIWILKKSLVNEDKIIGQVQDSNNKQVCFFKKSEIELL